MKTQRNRKSTGRQRGFVWESVNAWNWLFLLAGVASTAFLYQFGWIPKVLTTASLTRRTQLPAAPMNGAWGHLEVTPIELEWPEEFRALELPVPTQIRWFFGKRDCDKLADFLRACEFPARHQASLLNSNAWEIGSGGIWVTPPMDLIREMSPTSRQKVYSVLVRHPENAAHCYPNYCRYKSFEEWFADCELDTEKLEMISRMTYQRRGVTCFSDSEYLQHTLTPEEMRRVSQTLSRTGSLFAKLRITPESDLDAILAYWGTTSRARKVRPLLESLKRLPEGGDLNVTWFFPPVPRLLVYSYPHPTNMIAGKYPDCVWSSLNFFNEVPDDQTFDAGHCATVLKRDYHSVPKAGLFGDIIMFSQQDGTDVVLVHMCVFVADNIVFTKNGYDPKSPWVLMPLEDVLLTYKVENTTSVSVLRRNRR